MSVECYVAIMNNTKMFRKGSTQNSNPLSAGFSFTLTFLESYSSINTGTPRTQHNTLLSRYQLSHKTLIGINSAPSPNRDQGTWHANSIRAGRHKRKEPNQTKPDRPTDQPNERTTATTKQKPKQNWMRNVLFWELGIPTKIDYLHKVTLIRFSSSDPYHTSIHTMLP